MQRSSVASQLCIQTHVSSLQATSTLLHLGIEGYILNPWFSAFSLPPHCPHSKACPSVTSQISHGESSPGRQRGGHISTPTLRRAAHQIQRTKCACFERNSPEIVKPLPGHLRIADSIKLIDRGQGHIIFCLPT